jgi:hypothetical protein
LTFALILILRFLWVDLQFKAILDACEEDGAPDRIPDLFERPPRKVVELYSLALAKLYNGDTKLAELAKKVFQWVVCSRRPLTIHELEEAISITTVQKSWAIPPFKLDLSKLCRMCGNLVKYDKANKAISLAHHTVRSFLLDCSDTPGIASFAFEESRAEQYLADICLTYLSFVDFHKSITRTSDTTSVHALNQPLRLASAILPTSIRPLASLSVKSSRFSSGTNRQVNMVNVLRSELSRHQSPRPDPSFQLLEYCKAYWHKHSLYMDIQDTKSLTNLESFIRRTHFPQEWKPWNFITDQKSLPYWNIFLWAVREGHAVIFHVWQNIVTMQEASYWNYLWLDKGQRLFASACTTANLEQLEIILRAKGKDKRVVRPSIDEISHELVRICHLGHSEVVERLLQEKVDVNAAARGNGRTALQAAAEGGRLAVVEQLLQEKADVNAAAAEWSGRTALQAAAEGGHLAVVERLLQEKADVNAAAARDNGRTALQAAAEGGHLAVVERLLQEKAKVNAAARGNGRTALQAAAEGGHLAVVERLRAAGAD